MPLEATRGHPGHVIASASSPTTSPRSSHASPRSSGESIKEVSERAASILPAGRSSGFVTFAQSCILAAASQALLEFFARVAILPAFSLGVSRRRSVERRKTAANDTRLTASRTRLRERWVRTIFRARKRKTSPGNAQ
ncbi:hypothetical protein MRX96_012505 [Rhipicephalus microplus]